MNKYKSCYSSIILVCFLASPLQSHSITLSIGDLTGFLNTSNAPPIHLWMANLINQELDKNGIKSSVDGVTYSNNFHHENDDCAHHKHKADINYSLSLFNSTKIILDTNNVTNLNSPIHSLFILDGNAQTSGFIEFKPSEWYSIGIGGVCTQFTSIHKDVPFNQNISAKADLNVNLNPHYLTSSESASGNPEISFTPSGTVTINIGEFDPTLHSKTELIFFQNINDSVSFLQTVNAVWDFFSTASASGEPITIAVTIIGNFIIGEINKVIAEFLDETISSTVDYVIDDLFKTAYRNWISQFSGSGYTVNITNQIKPIQNIILPNENSIASIILPQLLEKSGGARIVSGDAQKNPAKALYDFLVGNKLQIDLYVQQSRQAQAAVLSAINLLLLSEESCSYFLAPAYQTVTQAGGNFGVNLTSGGECHWQIQSDAAWAMVTSTNNGSGNSTIQYSINANTLTNSRSSHINILDDNNQQVAQFTINQEAGADIDTDGVIDSNDNCRLTANLSQLDSDGDHFGNACDADLNNDCKTNSLDLGKFKSVYGTNTGTPALKAAADFNGDSRVNSLDLGLFKKLFGKAPGPSGLAACP